MSAPLEPTPKLLRSFTRTAEKQCLVHRPSTVDGLMETVARLRHANEAFSLLGGGNSFGDVFLPRGAHVIDTSAMSARGELKKENGTLTVECGLRSGPLSEYLLTQGYYLPSSAGSLTNTVAGDISSDVNGKDSWRVGNYASNVHSFRALLANGEVRHIDRSSPDLFNAFTGGLGMLGLILEVELEAEKAPSAHLTLNREVTGSLSDTLRAFSLLRPDEWHFAYAWVDVLGNGTTVGRSIIEKARFDEEGIFAGKRNAFAPKKRILGLTDEQFWAMYRGTQRLLRATGSDRLVAQVVNSIHYHRTRWDGRVRHGVPLTEYQYPMLKALPNWNKGISPKGMHELQFLFSETNFEQAFLEILTLLRKHRLYPLICAIRKHRSTTGLLSFSGDGLSFTVNFDRACLPDAASSDRVERTLMACAIRHGGKVYLSKYPYLTAEECAAMYPGLDDFKSVKAQLDPDNLFASATSERLLGG